ncbi:hypothetical protein C1645_767878 [Glomus cerebriforme]|uniref:Uncharacterized protein n=1 Tax=Glomus cerebriforme TaxID=658196 RepID=A0A397T8A3_9GLOM|nr:hypothetical protein C1645_767878 [Glomus cerebriforme]
MHVKRSFFIISNLLSSIFTMLLRLIILVDKSVIFLPRLLFFKCRAREKKNKRKFFFHYCYHLIIVIINCDFFGYLNCS